MKKQGSAIITIIVAIVVLTVLALSFISSKSQRANINKFLSDEKKAETLAESVSDLVLSYLKNNANKSDKAKKLYYFLRMPLKIVDTSIKEGNNFKLEIPSSNKLDEDLYNNVKDSIQPIIDEIDWKDKVKIESRCEISSAETFGAANKDYKVAGIDCQHLPSKGVSSNFYDSPINNIHFTNEPNDNWKPSNWKIRVKFPSGHPTLEEKKFKVHITTSTTIADVMREVNDAIDELSKAKEELRKAKKDLSDAQEAGESEEKIAELQSAVDDAEKKVSEAESKHAETMSAYNEAGGDDIKASGIGIKVTIVAERDNENSLKLRLKAKLSGFIGFIARLLGLEDEYPLPEIDCEKEMNDAQVFPNIETLDMKGLKKAVIDGDPNYDFSTYVNNIKERMENVTEGYLESNSSLVLSDSYSEPMVVEKGAILRITTKVEYKPNDSKIITRELVSEIPFKVSDLQPIAPEYTFFVANSNKISEDSDILNTNGHKLGEPIDMNNIGKKADGSDKGVSNKADESAGRFIVHNLPYSGDKPSYDSVGYDTGKIPGMLRINCNYKGKDSPATDIYSYIGCFEEPEITELNQMLTPDYSSGLDNKFNTKLSFFWADGASDSSSAKRYHEIELPILFASNKKNRKIPIKGVKGFIGFYRQGGFDFVIVPTLLYGQGHMEYPLGINAEGPIKTVYSRIRVSAKPDAIVAPKADPVVTDMTEIYLSYENITTYSDGEKYNFNESAIDAKKYGGPSHYGMIDHPCYKEDDEWLIGEKSDYKFMPSNCYDAMQYAKKATRFYEDGQDFVSDCVKPIDKGGLKDSEGNVVLSGVYYIKGSLNLPKTTFKGNGLIVARNYININGDINRADKTTTVGLIARIGFLTFNCDEVHAACFSNNAPYFPNGGKKPTKIFGNLVCNDFDRERVLDAEIFYENQITSVTPLASLRKVGKFEPKRYHVEFANNWSKFNYEKAK